MTPTFHLQEAVHQIGPITWGMLKDLGWDMNSSIFITEPTKSFNTIYLASDPLLVEWLDTYENGSIVTNISLFVNGVTGDSLITDTSQNIYSNFGINSIELNLPGNLPQNKKYIVKITTSNNDIYTSDGYFPIQNNVQPPSSYPPGGKYVKNTGIRLQSNYANNEIYYTTDKTIPTKQSLKFESAIPLEQDFTLTAKVFVGNQESDTLVANYIVDTNPLNGTAYCGGVPSNYGPVGTTQYTKELTQEYRWGINGGTVYRSFIEFNLSSIPRNIVIDDVRFSTFTGSDSLFTSLYTLDYNSYFSDIPSVKYNSFTEGTNSKEIDRYWPHLTNWGYEYDFTSPKLTEEIRAAYTANKSTILLGIKATNEPGNKSVYAFVPASLLYVDYHYLPGNYLVDQVDKDKNSFGFVGLWNSSKWDTLFVPITKNFPKGTTQNPLYQYFLASQEYKNGTTQKFRDWKDGSVINHRKYNITAAKDSIIARFDQSSYATVQNYFEGNVNGGKISFKDPWIVDSVDAKGGFNRGVNAVFHDSLPAPFNPGSSSLYKGVFLNQNPTFDPILPNYSVKASQTQNINLGSPWGMRTFYFQNWSANTETSASLQDANALETGVVFKEADATVSANYKGTQLSNTSTAFANNSQRKFIRKSTTALYAIYESMNTCWLEFSADDGNSWMILNSGYPITEPVSSSPSLALVGDLLLITYIHNNNVKLAIVNTTTNILNSNITVSEYPGCATPVVYASNLGNANFLVVWKSTEQPGLFFRTVYWQDDNANGVTMLHFFQATSQVEGTDQYSCSPTLVFYPGSNTTRKYMLAYEQQNSGNTASNIYYTSFTSANNVTVNSTVIPISSSSGYTWNYNPSIIELNGFAKVVWIGKRVVLPQENLAKVESEDGTTIVTNYEYRTIFKDPSYYRYWSFGSNVNSPSINKTDNNSAYVFGWAETNGTVTNKFADNTLSTIRTLNTTGKYLQLCNGADKYSMFALSFTNTALPYNFTLSNSVGSVALAKENSSLSVNKGREGVVVKDSSQIYFTLGDVLVNGENISFKAIPDTFSITSAADVNNCVKTNPFSVTDNSSLFYSVQYGVSNAEQLKRTFTESDIISFRIELVEAATETVLGLFDNISYTKQNAVSYDNFSYEVSTEGIGNKTVYLRLVTTASEGCSFSITDKLDNQSIIAKRYVKQVAFKSAQVIKDYALAQNYPNPFNPVTTITYQLPKSGSVTLKIYDMLGKEVKTLVNEQKEMGRYTVQFDASSLASGMYVYQLRANDYTSTKKMMLLK